MSLIQYEWITFDQKFSSLYLSEVNTRFLYNDIVYHRYNQLSGFTRWHCFLYHQSDQVIRYAIVFGLIEPSV